MKALRVVCILVLLGLLAVSVPAAAEGPGVAEAPVGDVVHFIPVINNLRTGLEVMNLGATQTYVDIWYYDATGGNVATTYNMKINGLSSRTIYPLPSGAATAQSAVVVSQMDMDSPESPVDDEKYTYGEDIAVTVNRFGSGGVPAATYTGIGKPLLPYDEAAGNVPYSGQDTFWIYAPIIHKNNNTWNSTIWVQHAYLADLYGWNQDPLPDADVDVYFYEPDGGLPVAAANLYIPAFASVALPSPATLADGVYSAWIRSHSPICAAVDEYNSATLGDATGMFLSYRASPKNRWDEGSSAANFNFGPLIFSQYNGWQAGIAVLNTSENNDADVVATFRAVDGTPLRTVHARLEERSDWLIYPLSDFGLPVDQIGSVTIEAQNYWPPGGEEEANDAIVAVVNQINETASMGSAYNAFRATFHPDTGDWDDLDTATYLAGPLMMKYNGGSTLTSGWSTGMVVMNTDLDSYVAERIELSFWDAAGGPVAVDTISINLRGGETHVVDLRHYYTGGSVFIPSGWVGSCTVDSRIGDVHPPIAAVVNEIYDAPAGAAQVAGDFFMTYEAYPVSGMALCVGDIFGKVHSIDPCEDPLIDASEAIQGVRVSAAGVTTGIVDDYTDSTGDYEVEDVKAGTGVSVEFSHVDFLDFETSVDLECGDHKELSAELLCLGDIVLMVEQHVGTKTENGSTDTPEPDALVEYYVTYPAKADHYGAGYYEYDYTDASGVVTLTVPLLDTSATITVTKPNVFETGKIEWNPMSEATDTVEAGPTRNSQVAGGDVGTWADAFDDDDCANITPYTTVDNSSVPVQLCALGTIAGKVEVALTGTAGFLVEAIDKATGITVNSATTDTFGRYAIAGLPSGIFGTAPAKTYKVRVSKAGYFSQETEETFTECGEIIKDVNFAY